MIVFCPLRPHALYAPLAQATPMKTLDVKILDARLKDNLPGYATPGSAGLDLRACIDASLTLAPGETRMVSTGIAIHLGDPGFAALVLPRSGLARRAASCSAISWA